MSRQKLVQTYLFSRSWFWLWFTVILLGIFFRFAYLGDKIYWVDEVVTSLHIAGYTQQEVTTKLSQQSLISVADLQKYQQISSEKNFFDALEACKENPEHTPLYFILTRFWVELWGNSVVTIRSLSVVFSLLILPCFYWLCIELFQSPSAGWIGIALLSVSPFYVTYGQEARPYSLWTVTILLSSVTLLRAIRLNNRISWFLYLMSLIIGFYTSLLSFLVTIGQIIYVMILAKLNPYYKDRVVKCLLCCSLLLITLSPWLIIIIQKWQLVTDNTIWMREPIQPLEMMAIYLYGISSLFIESPIYKLFDIFILTRIIVDINLFILLMFSVYFVMTKEFKKIGIFILCIGFIHPLILMVTDLVFHGQRSTPPRYMIPFYLALQLAFVYFLNHKIFSSPLTNYKQQRTGKVILAVTLLISIASCSFNLDKSPKYQKTRNLHNIPISKIINQAKSPLILSEKDNLLDMISLSYSFQNKVDFKILSNFLMPSADVFYDQDLFVLNPSARLIDQIKQEKQVYLEQVYRPTLFVPNELYLSIWQIKKM